MTIIATILWYYNAYYFLQGMTNNIRLGFGDTTHAIYNSSWARQIELVTLNTTFSVATSSLSFTKDLQNHLTTNKSILSEPSPRVLGLITSWMA